MQLRHKLFIALALLTSVPLLVLLFGVVDRVEGEVKQRTANELHADLDKLAGELDVLLSSQKSIAKGLASVPAITDFASTLSARSPADYRLRNQQLERFFLNYQHAVGSIQALRFMDSSGRTLVKVKEGKPVAPEFVDRETGRSYVADQSEKNFFRLALNSNEDVVMSDFELGQVSYETEFCPAMLRYSVPIRDEFSRPLGLLVLNMWGTRVDSIVETSLGGYPGRAYIVELNPGTPRDGIYLYHADDDRRFADQTGSNARLSSELTPEEWQAIQAADTSGSLFRADGRMLFYNKFSPYRDRPVSWLLVIETDAATLLAPIRSMRLSIWMLLGTLLIVSLLVASWAAWRLSRPAHELAGIISRYAEGDLSVRYRGEDGDEIGQAGKAFNRLATSLERATLERDKAELAVRQSERLAAVGQLAAGVGHEINNPLMNIMSLAGLIERSLGTEHEEVLADVRLLQSEGRRCARIVQGILNFSRRTQPSYRSFDLVELLEDTLVLMHHRVDAGDILLRRELPESLVIEGDPNLLQQVFVNVLLNAVQASPPGSTIRVQAGEQGKVAMVEIYDEGPGIAQGDLAHIFNPFFTTKPEGEGTGLGLSVSYGIVKEHGGEISTDNADAAGLCVRIELPIRRPRSEQSETRELEPANAV